MYDDTFRGFLRALRLISVVLLLGIMGISVLLAWFNPEQTTSSNPTADSDIAAFDPYERMEVWDVQGNDAVRFTTLDTYPGDSSKRMKWLSVPFLWKDADMTKSTPLECTVIEHHVEDQSYGGQTYRWHTYLVESSQRKFGYSASFKVLPHVHITGTATRLLSIGVDPSHDAVNQTKFAIAVILPGGVRNITITDFQPYKTLTYSGRTLYYYDARTITAHQSIHIAYTLTDTPTTDIGIDTVINYSNP